MPILITDGGHHPPEKWGMATAEMIFIIGPKMEGARLFAAKRLQLAIAEALVNHHTDVMNREVDHLAGDHAARKDSADVRHDLHVEEATDEAKAALDDVKAVCKGTEWEHHYDDAETAGAAIQVIASHFMTSKHIHRSWHSDGNPRQKH